MNEDFLIKVNIAGKQYQLYIERDELTEEIIRKASAQVNKQIELYRTTYNTNSLTERDLLAMAALDLTRQKIVLEHEKEVDSIKQRIEASISNIDTFLDQQEI